MKRFVDSNVIVHGLMVDCERHALADPYLNNSRAILHSKAECFAILTAAYKVVPAAAQGGIASAFPVQPCGVFGGRFCQCQSEQSFFVRRGVMKSVDQFAELGRAGGTEVGSDHEGNLHLAGERWLKFDRMGPARPARAHDIRRAGCHETHRSLDSC